jgi:non-ribosomal peptide synthetase component F
MKDVMLVVLNSEGVQTGVGELGEIYMRSPHLAKGYKGLVEQTKEKFSVNPFTNHPRDRLYRTGDLGRYM